MQQVDSDPECKMSRTEVTGGAGGHTHWLHTGKSLNRTQIDKINNMEPQPTDFQLETQTLPNEIEVLNMKSGLYIHYYYSFI